MDWSLVLASQDISSTILQADPSGWALAVEPQEYERALEAIRQYRLENRRWGWRQRLPVSGMIFHWGALNWCALLALVHWALERLPPEIRGRATFASERATAGEWWRAFTAILLHADIGHLLANLSTGLILWGLAMARYGAGLGLLSAYVCGAAGNAAGLTLYPRAYVGVGASGMVMGALGLLTIPPLLRSLTHPWATKQVMQAVGGGLLLFLLFGVNPASDVIAHVGGYVCGMLVGIVLALLPERVLQSKVVTIGSVLVLAMLVGWTGWLAETAGTDPRLSAAGR
jgi:membrane associated rhomboid family serine protease